MNLQTANGLILGFHKNAMQHMLSSSGLGLDGMKVIHMLYHGAPTGV